MAPRDELQLERRERVLRPGDRAFLIVGRVLVGLAVAGLGIALLL